MKSLRLILIALSLSVLLIGGDPVLAQEVGGNWEEDLSTNSDGAHELRIEASQWEFNVYDMVSVAEYEADGDSYEEAMQKSHYKHRIGRIIKGATVIMSIVSRDVQHGFAINEVGVLVATVRPGVGEEFGAQTFATWVAPDEDVTYSSFCHIFCGLGHPDMKLKFIIGAGSVEYGRYVYWAILAVNIVIFGITFSKISKKLSLAEEQIVA